MPNKWAIVRYSVGVARHHKVTATHRSTDRHFLNNVSVLVSAGANLPQMYKNVSLDIRKISSQSCSVKVCNTVLFHQKSDLKFYILYNKNILLTQINRQIALAHKLNNNKNHNTKEDNKIKIQYIFIVPITKLELINTLKKKRRNAVLQEGRPC